VTSNIDLTIDFYAALNREKLLSKYIYFHRLKYLSVKNNFDFSGGFIRFGEVKTIASLLKTSHHNIRKLIKAFVDLGWLMKKKTGYVLIGWREIAKKYGFDRLSKIKFFDYKKTELMCMCANLLIVRSIDRQIYRNGGKLLSKARLKKTAKILAKDEKYTMSVRGISKRLGYSCAMTGTRMQKSLEKKGLLKVKRKRTKFLCGINEYHARIKVDETLERKCYVVGRNVYQRLCNNLIPIKKKEHVNEFLKNALMIRKASAI